jgi:hypothetical protein
VIQPPPAPVVQPPPPQTAGSLQQLLQVSGNGTVTGVSPADGSTFTTGQLEAAQSIHFVWEGKTSEYRFALYRTSGELIIPPSAVESFSYILFNPGLLTEGEYVWQVYEKNRRGDWELPSAASRLTVVRGPAGIKTLQTKDPGVLYGNP